jgi:hypothetical protein
MVQMQLPPPPPDSDLPDWLPEYLVEGFDRYTSMTEPERERFAERLTEYDQNPFEAAASLVGWYRVRAEASKQRELRFHCVGLFLAVATEELARAMSQPEDAELPIEKASLAIITHLSGLADRARYQARLGRRGRRIVTAPAPEWTEWILLFPPHSIFGFIRGTRDVCLHVAAGDKPRRFRKGWKKPG